MQNVKFKSKVQNENTMEGTEEKSEMPGMQEGKSKYKLKDVKLSGYTIEGHYYKRCPNCGCKTAMEKEE